MHAFIDSDDSNCVFQSPNSANLVYCPSCGVGSLRPVLPPLVELLFVQTNLDSVFWSTAIKSSCLWGRHRRCSICCRSFHTSYGTRPRTKLKRNDTQSFKDLELRKWNSMRRKWNEYVCLAHGEVFLTCEIFKELLKLYVSYTYWRVISPLLYKT